MKRTIMNLAFLIYTFGCCMLLFGANGQAYIDPSVMTYVIQAVAGIVIASGAAVGLYLRKAKKHIKNKLGVDENAGKEKESDEIQLK